MNFCLGQLATIFESKFNIKWGSDPTYCLKDEGSLSPYLSPKQL